MANPQLVSYIKQQLGLGDTESSIKNNLKSVGWADSDVVDAFKEASPTPAAAPTSPASPSPAIPSTPATPSAPAMKPAMPANPSPIAPAAPNLNAAPTTPRKVNLDAFAPMSSPSPMARPFSASPATISFTAGKPMESIFQPQAAVPATPATPGINPNPMMPAMSVSTTAPKRSWGTVVTVIIMVLIIAGLAGLSWVLYQNNSTLKAQVESINTQLSALSGQNSNSQTLAAQIAALQDENKDLGAQLSLFLPRSATSTETVTLKGTVGGGGKLNYTLTTSKGLVVSVKNSKDAKVAATLGPLVGTTATLTGIPTSVAREITVTLVNGAEPSLPAAPAASSTSPNATSTASSTTP